MYCNPDSRQRPPQRSKRQAPSSSSSSRQYHARNVAHPGCTLWVVACIGAYDPAPRMGSTCRAGGRVLHYLNFAWHGHGTTHGKPWPPHGSPWCGIGLHATAWGVPWNATGGTMATYAATATALHGSTTEYHGNPRGTPMFTAPRLGLGLELGFHGMMPWKVLPQVVPRHVMKKVNNVHPSLGARAQVQHEPLFGGISTPNDTDHNGQQLPPEQNCCTPRLLF